MGQKQDVVRSCPEAEVLRKLAPAYTEGAGGSGVSTRELPLQSSF